MQMDSLFKEVEDARRVQAAPLAVRMRPQSLGDVVGQQEAIGPDSWLRRAIEADTLSSVILFGPAGTGKTSIAHVIANTTRSIFVEVSAIGGTVSDLRREIAEAERRLVGGGIRTILFVDEIHRFSRSQQDALLHAVEDRVVVLVGATTENPFFEVNSALLSRSRIVELHSLSDDDIAALLDRAVGDPRGLGGRFALDEQARDSIVMLAGGDARSALTTLELASEIAQGEFGGARGDGAKAGEGAGASGSSNGGASVDASGASSAGSAGSGNASGDVPAGPIAVTEDMVSLATPHRVVPYDKNKDMHYDIISAFIKSMRGSDPDAALYWLARMIDGGEDPKFIARRIFICAAEDVGNADPQALLVAEAAFKSAEVIGMPECQLVLAQAATYMALAPKSNSACGIFDALDEVRGGPVRKVPDYLRDRHRPGSENYGAYLYPHDQPGAWVDQRYLPEGLERGAFWHPTDRGWEGYRTEIADRDHVPGDR